MKKNRGLTPLTAVIMLSGSLVLTACDNKASQQNGQQQAPEVGITTLKSGPLKITTDLPGRTSSFRVAEVRPQVSGIILKRNFVEGSDIKAGESLYQIDPATYQAAYDSAKGELAQAQANAQIAATTVKRYKPLLGTKYISQQEYDTAAATQSQTAAAVVAARAALESARINVAYTKVTSPISGRIGKSSVTEGALVTSAQTTALASVQQLDPIYVDVTQPGEDFMRLRDELTSGKIQQANGKAEVKLLLQNGSEYAQSGTLEFSDVTVDETTGSITLRAIFPNPDHNLLPGMFVRARLEEGTNPNALLVPQQSVTRTPTGQATAMVVGPDNKVEVRNLTANQAIGDKWLVSDGLKAGDRVIVTGLQRVKPGIAVTPQEISDDSAKATTPAQSEQPKS
ncbi:efflux RND transporter periplasmic adaptor subunit [Erwinia piriflorinigrans]|uniref:Membrane-fusion protein n=1 Tax=Erwinia piriflorinigrans CFBP 5888 TaxID=1161919 RepID=V5Z616_9GAMM|nr:efflux RND transporter periplasmic adaptor subunit [Erwinia piriflorinigrans]CCG86445.1 Membrane-fusion protein [Erwinia piriflorinigrans CFBP 5888]